MTDQTNKDHDSQANENTSQDSPVPEQSAQEKAPALERAANTNKIKVNPESTNKTKPESKATEQAEQKDKPVTQSNIQKPESIQPVIVKKSSSALGWLALLVALSGAGLAGWMYWQDLQTDQQKDQLAQQLTQQQNQFIQSMQQDQTTANNALKNQLSQTLNQYQSQVEQQITKQQQAVQKAIDDITTNFNNSQTQAVLVDVAHLIQLASRKLYIEADKAGAVAILKLAQTELAQQQNSQWFNLSNLISADIANIQTLKQTDIQGLYLKLTEINQSLLALPLNQAEIPKNAPNSAQQTPTSTISWQNLEIIWRQFLDLFLPKQREGSVEPLLSPKQIQNLQQNLTSKINQAQWAVLHQQNEIYQTALTQTENWIKQYYQLESVPINQIINDIAELKQVEFAQDFSKLELKSAAATHNLLNNSQPVETQNNNTQETL